MADRPPVKLIVVDDDRLTRNGIARHLPWHTIGVVVAGLAEHGRAGLALVEEVDPDVIITDVKMPVMDGIAFIEQLYERQCRARIILLSGFRDFDYAQQAIRFGVADYVLKPVDERELLDAVSRCLQSTDRAPIRSEAILNGRSAPSVVNLAIEYIHGNYGRDITVGDVARHVMLHPNYLSTLFSESTGVHCSTYLARYRVEQAKRLLQRTCLKVYEIAERVGIADYRRFTRTFRKHAGTTPSSFRRLEGGCAEDGEGRASGDAGIREVSP